MCIRCNVNFMSISVYVYIAGLDGDWLMGGFLQGIRKITCLFSSSNRTFL